MYIIGAQVYNVTPSDIKDAAAAPLHRTSQREGFYKKEYYDMNYLFFKYNN